MAADGSLRSEVGPPPHATPESARAAAASFPNTAAGRLAGAAVVSRAERGLLSASALERTRRLVGGLAGPWSAPADGSAALPVAVDEALAICQHLLFFGARVTGKNELEVPVPEQREARAAGSLLELARGALEDHVPVLGLFEVEDSGAQVIAHVTLVAATADTTSLRVVGREARDLRTNVGESLGRLQATNELPRQVARGIEERRADLAGYAARCAVLGLDGRPAARATPAGMRLVLRALALPDDAAPLALTSGPILITV